MRNGLGDQIIVPHRIPPEYAGAFANPRAAVDALQAYVNGNPPPPGPQPLTAPMAQLWAPQPIIPDSQLPPGLQRVRPFNRPFFAPNGNDQAMLQQAAIWSSIAQNGGPEVCCRIPELSTPVYQQDPRMVMPPGAQRFGPIFALPLAQVSGGPPFNGTDTVLGSFQCEIGYDGIINRFVCSYTGAGFDDFSGNIVWRLKIGLRFAKDLGNVQNTYGSYQTAFQVPGSYIPLVSQQTVQLIANIPNGAPLMGGFVTAGVFGWFYSRR